MQKVKKGKLDRLLYQVNVLGGNEYIMKSQVGACGSRISKEDRRILRNRETFHGVGCKYDGLSETITDVLRILSSVCFCADFNYSYSAVQ